MSTAQRPKLNYSPIKSWSLEDYGLIFFRNISKSSDVSLQKTLMQQRERCQTDAVQLFSSRHKLSVFIGFLQRAEMFKVLSRFQHHSRITAQTVKKCCVISDYQHYNQYFNVKSRSHIKIRVCKPSININSTWKFSNLNVFPLSGETAGITFLKSSQCRTVHHQSSLLF